MLDTKTDAITITATIMCYYVMVKLMGYMKYYITLYVCSVSLGL